jgi:hypothetical protein
MSTESETPHKVTNKDVRDTLHSVIESLIDGQEGFQKIGEHLKDEALRRYFAANLSSALHSEANWRRCFTPKEITIQNRVVV